MDCNALPRNDIADLEQARTRQLADQISELCAYIYAAEHRLLTLIREFDEREGWQSLGFPNCASWLNFQCGIDMNTARERVRVAHALGRLPKVDARFAKGAISYSKVRAISRIADETNEDYLLMIAKHGTAYHVEKLVQKYRRSQTLQDSDSVESMYENRQLRHHYDSDGCLVIKGRFPAELGALIVKALEMAMEAGYRENSGETPDSDDLPKGDVSAETPERPPIATRRADALAGIAETYMNSEPVPNSTADRYQVVVHVEAASTATDVAANHLSPTHTAHIEDGPHVSAETSRRIACDCSLLRVDDNEHGEPLSIGRKSRSIPPAMRRALRLRDGGCRFPGCTRDRFVDGHHIEHWANGGETSLDNLVLLCRHHHHLVHEGGFSCEKTTDGEVVFTDTRKTVIPGFPELPTVDAAEIKAWLDREFFESEIDADTCRSQWLAGERMDWDLAVSNLCVAAN